MSTLFQPTALVGAIALAMGFSTSVFAAESQDQRVVNVALDTLVVTASRSEQNIKDVPARINVIDEKTIEQSPITDLPTLLTKEAGPFKISICLISERSNKGIFVPAIVAIFERIPS